MKTRLTNNEKNLIRRYCLWCYKTTKEDLDRIDRYFTQDLADERILKTLKSAKAYKSAAGAAFKKRVDEFEAYMAKKTANAADKKYADGRRKKLNPDYEYLKNRLAAVEGAIRHFLGAKELTAIVRQYELEMSSRILQAREHT